MKRLLFIFFIILLVLIIIYNLYKNQNKDYYRQFNNYVVGNYIILFDDTVQNQNYNNISFEVDVRLPNTTFNKTITISGQNKTFVGTINKQISYVLTEDLYGSVYSSLTYDEQQKVPTDIRAAVVISRIKIITNNFEGDIKNKWLAVATNEGFAGGRDVLEKYGVYNNGNAIFINKIVDKSSLVMIMLMNSNKWSYNCNDLDCSNDTNNCTRCQGHISGPNCDTCQNGFTGVNCAICRVGFTGVNCDTCSNVHFTGVNCDTCRVGFTGVNCDTCLTNWTGVNCDTCQNGFTGVNCATCQNGFTGVNCAICRVGFTGVNCATCRVGFSGVNCNICSTRNFTGVNCDTCNIGFTGVNCDSLKVFSSSSWTRMMNTPFNTVNTYDDMVCGSYGDYIILIGNAIYRYSISGNEWTTISFQNAWGGSTSTFKMSSYEFHRGSAFWQVDSIIYMYCPQSTVQSLGIRQEMYTYNISTGKIVELLSSTNVSLSPGISVQYGTTWTDSSNNLWLFGGTPNWFAGSPAVNTLYKFTINTNTWSTISSTNTPSARVRMKACTVGSTTYLFGGLPGTISSEFYSFTNNTFTLLTPTLKPSGRQSPCMWVIGTNVYLYGGYLLSSYTNADNRVWKYSTTTQIWQVMDSKYNLDKRTNANVIVINTNTVLICGGSTPNAVLNDIWGIKMAE